MNSNHLPKTRDSSEGFNRRWLILEFNNRIPADRRVIDLDAQILEHERDAIVAWAIQGYKRLMDNGSFTLPTSHLALVESMAADNSVPPSHYPSQVINRMCANDGRLQPRTRSANRRGA